MKNITTLEILVKRTSLAKKVNTVQLFGFIRIRLSININVVFFYWH